jgi:mycoredoxin
MLNIYATSWCPHCVRTIDFLKNRGIEYNYIDMDKVPEDVENEIIRVNGGEDWVVPTLEFKGQWRPGKIFNQPELENDLREMGVID